MNITRPPWLAPSPGKAAGELEGERSREAGDDTHQDYEGDTVADSAVGDALTEPHDEHGAGGKDYGEISHSPKAQANEWRRWKPR